MGLHGFPPGTHHKLDVKLDICKITHVFRCVTQRITFVTLRVTTKNTYVIRCVTQRITVVTLCVTAWITTVIRCVTQDKTLKTH